MMACSREIPKMESNSPQAKSGHLGAIVQGQVCCRHFSVVFAYGEEEASTISSESSISCEKAWVGAPVPASLPLFLLALETRPAQLSVDTPHLS
jgi:hypothetical protein